MIKINENFLNLQDSYLFSTIAKKVSEFQNNNPDIKIVGKCKNYPIYYAECNVGNYQNYMLCCDMYSDDVQASSNININANKCEIQIEKIDKFTKFPRKGVKFLFRHILILYLFHLVIIYNFYLFLFL